MGGKVYVENREIVVPGQLLAEGDMKISSPMWVYKQGNKYYSCVVGLASVDEKSIGIIPLEGFYYPSPGDLVIGVVENVGLTSWEIDIRAPLPAILYASDLLGKPINPAKEDLTDYLDVGDLVLAKIDKFDRTRDPLLTTRGKGLGKISKGVVVEINPVKVPRVIGKKGSMHQTLESETGCEIVVAKNGRILISCKNEEMEEIAVLAIRKIEREAHIPGLTDRIKEFILKEKLRRGLLGGK
jgi:exosome complex component RRP4